MQFTRLGPSFSVSGQIALRDIAEIAACGFITLINNRPDGEAADQPRSAEIEAEARRCGLRYCYIPVKPGEITQGDARRLADALHSASGPVLAFCRSGARSTHLWNAAQQTRSAAPH